MDKFLSQREFSTLAAKTAFAQINEFRSLSDSVARVTVSCSRNLTGEDLAAKVSASLGEGVAPIRNSFRFLNDDRTFAVGYVALCRATRVVEDATKISASYRVLANNLFLDEADKSMWELKDGVAGKYMVRTNEEDLTELLSMVRASPMGGTPRMSRISAAAAEMHELVAFVTLDSWVPDVDYGFCVGTNADGSYDVLSYTTQQVTNVKAEAAVGTYALDGEQFDAFKGSKASLKVSAGFDKGPVIEYYKKAYGYAPEYLALKIKMIEQQAAL